MSYDLRRRVELAALRGEREVMLTSAEFTELASDLGPRVVWLSSDSFRVRPGGHDVVIRRSA